MKKRIWYGIWAGLFILCACLGFIPEPTGMVKRLLSVTSVIFFMPGWVLLYLADKQQETVTPKIICGISGISLGLTLIFLVLNFLSGHASEAAGRVVHGFLVILSTPMVCSQHWALSLFLWAYLLFSGISAIKKAKK